MNNVISFGASFVQKLPIKKYSYETKTYTPDYASMAELNPYDKNDVDSVYEIARDFGGDTYASNIYYDIKSASHRDKNKYNIRFFVLTRQKDNFEKIQDIDVLGIAEIHQINDREIDIDYIQTHPKYVYPVGPKYIKRIGTAILNYFKQDNDKISLLSGNHAFYRKNGFKKISPNGNRMLWVREK